MQRYIQTVGRLRDGCNVAGVVGVASGHIVRMCDTGMGHLYVRDLC